MMVVPGAIFSAASAAVVPITITNLQVTPENPQSWDPVMTTFDWCVPDGTRGGDYATVSIPDIQEVVPATFDLTADNGQVLATATYEAGPPRQYRIVFSDLVNDQVGVCGDAYFGSKLGTTEPNTTYTLDYYVNNEILVCDEGDEGCNVITTQPPPENPHNTAQKWGVIDRNDPNRITWGIDTPHGPYTTATITDTLPADAGFVFNCAVPLEVAIVQIISPTDSEDVSYYSPAVGTFTCTPTSITVTLPGVDRADYFQSLRIVATRTDPGKIAYSNKATVKIDSQEVETPGSTVRDPVGGGTGNGHNEPHITIVKKDVNGNDADNAGEAPVLGVEPAATTLVYTITNDGNEPLRDIVVTDELIANGTITGLTCTFPDGTTGTTWAGPFKIGASFECRAQLSGVMSGTPLHQNIGKVTGVGVNTGTVVNAQNPYHATATAPAVLPTPPVVQPTTPVTQPIVGARVMRVSAKAKANCVTPKFGDAEVKVKNSATSYRGAQFKIKAAGKTVKRVKVAPGKSKIVALKGLPVRTVVKVFFGKKVLATTRVKPGCSVVAPPPHTGFRTVA